MENKEVVCDSRGKKHKTGAEIGIFEKVFKKSQDIGALKARKLAKTALARKS